MCLSTISLLISILALCFSIYIFWENNFRIKNTVTLGKDAKLIVVKNQPSILLNLAIINTGGKTSFIENIKIILKLTKKGSVFLTNEMYLKREFTGSFDNSVNDYIYNEISPIVIIGKTFITKKYLFTPNIKIQQESIENQFDIEIILYSKENNKWKKQKNYVSKNVSEIWNDLNASRNKNTIIELDEK